MNSLILFRDDRTPLEYDSVEFTNGWVHLSDGRGMVESYPSVAIQRIVQTNEETTEADE